MQHFHQSDVLTDTSSHVGTMKACSRNTDYYSLLQLHLLNGLIILSKWYLFWTKKITQCVQKYSFSSRTGTNTDEVHSMGMMVTDNRTQYHDDVLYKLTLTYIILTNNI